MSPLRFRPLYMERVWGGRRMETFYGRRLPTPDRPYGESWELVDRENEQSVVVGGRFDGMTLHDLWTRHREEVFGSGLPASPRFPLLVKVLDACDDLSIQVHPPATVAPQLGGEPKTEMWFIAAAEPGAKLHVGLRRGVTRAAFEQAITAGTVAACVHALQPSAGESIFIPSGRLHAIGAGLLIFEIQQNSDTTYRVFDWNRTGLDGRPRQLHVAESLASIDFDDFEPAMDEPRGNLLADCPHFRVERFVLTNGAAAGLPHAGRFAVFAVAAGVVACGGEAFRAGDFFLVPPDGGQVVAAGPATVLRVTVPN